MILCAGEALIDMLPRDTDEGQTFLPAVGGALFNSAIALGRLGQDTALLAGVSTDSFGQRLANALTDNNVRTDLLIRSARQTTIAYVSFASGTPEYDFYDAASAGRMIGEDDLPDVRPAAALFGGISLVSEPCGATYEALLNRISPHSVIMLDPNIRPDFITDEGSYRARLRRMIAKADILKMSDEDAEWLGVQDAFTGPVYIETMGAKGVRLTARGKTTEFEVPAVNVVDTVAAGDTFNAGILASLSQSGQLDKSTLKTLPASEGPLSDAVNYAIRAAGINVTRAGANPPWKEEMTV